jgi:hypothetical protein
MQLLLYKFTQLVLLQSFYRQVSRASYLAQAFCASAVAGKGLVHFPFGTGIEKADFFSFRNIAQSQNH